MQSFLRFFQAFFNRIMYLVFCLDLSLFFLLWFGLTDGVRVQSFKYKDNHKVDGRDILQNMAVSSIAQCAYQCTKNKDCEDANFDKVSKSCQLLKKKPESVMLWLVEQTAFTYLGDNDEIKNYEKYFEIYKANSSCKNIYENGRSTGSKAYDLTFGMNTDWSMTYCMMDDIPGCGPGGWTLVMKVDGTKQVFTYGSSQWNEKTAYNEAAGQTGIEDVTETKTPAYWKTSFSKICLGMKRNSTGVVNWLKIDRTAESLYSLLADGTEKNTALGDTAWQSLFPDHVLEDRRCREGFNVQYGFKLKVRLGQMADDDPCDSINSAIGVGIRTGSYRNPCGSSIFYTERKARVDSNCFIFVQ